MKNRHKIQDDLIEENSTRDAFAGACLSADKSSIIAIFKASVRQKSCIAFNDSPRKWKMVVLDPKGPKERWSSVTTELDFMKGLMKR